MGKKGRNIPSTQRQARYMGVLAGRGVKWARDKLRGKHIKGLPKGRKRK